MKTYFKNKLKALLMPIVAPLVKEQIQSELAKQQQANHEEFAEEVKQVLLEAVKDPNYAISQSGC